MNQLGSRWALIVPAALALVACATQPLQTELIEKTTQVGGTIVHYKVVLPAAYDPAKAYPAILVFGGGPQTMNVVDNVLKGSRTPSVQGRRRTLHVEKGQPHRLDTLAGANAGRLFDGFEETEKGCSP